jgi:hypothetical protein
MLGRYQLALGEEPPRVRWENIFACEGAKLIQRDPWAGAVAVLTSIEFYASRLIEELLERVEEPLLHTVFKHILVDEHRHRALAIEAVHLLEACGFGEGPVAKGRLAVSKRLVDVFFDQIVAPALDKQASGLGLDGKRIYESARDEIAGALKSELSQPTTTSRAA